MTKTYVKNTQLAPGSTMNPMFKNRVINGDMRIDQRNNFVAVAVSTNGWRYTADRFMVFANNVNCPALIVSEYGTNDWRLLFYGDTGMTDSHWGYRFERSSIVDLVGKQVTVSCYLMNNYGTAVTWKALYPTAKDNYAATTQFATGSLTINNVWTRYSFTFVLDANCVNGLMLQVDMGTMPGVTYYWLVSKVQLEAGSVATDFEFRPYSVELAMCQRYYQKINVSARGWLQGQTYSMAVTVSWHPMRVLPTWVLIAPPSPVANLYPTTPYQMSSCSSSDGIFGILANAAGDTYAYAAIYESSGTEL